MVNLEYGKRLNPEISIIIIIIIINTLFSEGNS